MSLNSFKSKVSRKMKKYSCMLQKETGINEASSSKYIMVCNAGLVSGTKQEFIIDVFSDYCIQQVMMIPEKSYCFIEFRNEEAAIKAVDKINGKLVFPEVKGPLYLLMVEKLPLNPIINSCHAPNGLSVFYDFITKEEEKFLIDFAMNELHNSGITGNSLKHRVVKHYGYVFDYQVNNVDKTNLSCKPIPGQLNFVMQRLKNYGRNFEHWVPDQLTVNFYEPGQGIPPHVDTHSAFDEIILSLSLSSDVVMDFKSIQNDQYSCFLPRRSLLVMADESRYGWTHGITSRKHDTVESETGLTMQKRNMRISFTLRRTLDGHTCLCSYNVLCDSSKVSQSKSSFSIDNRIASELERIHVHEVYDKIADHFSETRHKPWPNVEEFVKSFDVGSIFVDIGCGNGKYLGLNSTVFQIGCDRSEKFATECYQKKYEALICTCLQLPVRSDVIDFCLCIAVIHHLSTEERRISAIKEIARVLKPQGKALIYVWAKNQLHDKHFSSYLKQNIRSKSRIIESDIDNHSVQFLQKVVNNEISLPVHVNRTQFKHEDMFVPWKMKTETKDSNNSEIFLRYYHVFEQGELERLCNFVEHVKVVKSYYDQGNWCVVLQKIV